MSARVTLATTTRRRVETRARRVDGFNASMHQCTLERQSFLVIHSSSFIPRRSSFVGEERERSVAKVIAMDVDAGVADENGGRTRRRAAVFNIIRVRGAAKSRPVARDAFSSRDDDEREGSTEVSNDVTSAFGFHEENGDGGGAGTRAHAARVFARVEGAEKQAIAAYGGGATEREECFYTRAEACERACAVSCEKAAVGAGADDAAELCESACAYACERQSDADGKFEVCLRGQGDPETRRWEEELERRARAAERAIGKNGNGNGNAPT